MAANIADLIQKKLPDAIVEATDNGLKVKSEQIVSVCRLLKENGFDYPASITGIDRKETFELIYHLTDISSGETAVIRTDLDHEKPQIDSVYPVWKGADWQEREIYDLLGVNFIGHPELRRILLPDDWEGYPLRKDYVMPEDDRHGLPADWSMLGDIEKEPEQICHRTPDGALVCEAPGRLRTEEVQISMGPQHPSTHGVLRLELILDGETVVDCRPDVGYLHRGMEKLAEMRTYIQFIPITDRFDYVSSMMNNAVYVGAIEKLAQIEVPERIEYIRVIMMELQRIASHLIFIGTMGLDLGATTPFL
jgi:NADH-quinone oxidoreductase subunit C/D